MDQPALDAARAGRRRGAVGRHHGRYTGKPARADRSAAIARLAELGGAPSTVKNANARAWRLGYDDLGGNLTAIKMALAMLVRHCHRQQTPCCGKRPNMSMRWWTAASTPVLHLAGHPRCWTWAWSPGAGLAGEGVRAPGRHRLPFISNRKDIDLELDQAAACSASPRKR